MKGEEGRDRDGAGVLGSEGFSESTKEQKEKERGREKEKPRRKEGEKRRERG